MALTFSWTFSNLWVSSFWEEIEPILKKSCSKSITGQAQKYSRFLWPSIERVFIPTDTDTILFQSTVSTGHSTLFFFIYILLLITGVYLITHLWVLVNTCCNIKDGMRITSNLIHPRYTSSAVFFACPVFSNYNLCVTLNL